MFVGVSRSVFFLQDNRSLKGKRKVVRSIVDRTKAKFNAAVAEVGANDDLKKIVIGITVVGNDSSHVDAMQGKIGHFIEQLSLAPMLSHNTEIIPIGDELGQTDSLPYQSDWDM